MTEPWVQWLTAVYPQWKSKKTALDNHNDDSDSTWWLHSMLWWFWLLWSLVVWWCRCVLKMINIAKVFNKIVRIFWWPDCLARCILCTSTGGKSSDLWKDLLNANCRQDLWFVICLQTQREEIDRVSNSNPWWWQLSLGADYQLSLSSGKNGIHIQCSSWIITLICTGSPPWHISFLVWVEHGLHTMVAQYIQRRCDL